jgi:hypothetical protein
MVGNGAGRAIGVVQATVIVVMECRDKRGKQQQAEYE